MTDTDGILVQTDHGIDNCILAELLNRYGHTPDRAAGLAGFRDKDGVYDTTGRTWPLERGLPPDTVALADGTACATWDPAAEWWEAAATETTTMYDGEEQIVWSHRLLYIASIGQTTLYDCRAAAWSSYQQSIRQAEVGAARCDPRAAEDPDHEWHPNRMIDLEVMVTEEPDERTRVLHGVDADYLRSAGKLPPELDDLEAPAGQHVVLCPAPVGDDCPRMVSSFLADVTADHLVDVVDAWGDRILDQHGGETVPGR